MDDDENGDTPLHLASLKGRTNVVRELVRVGASIRARSVLCYDINVTRQKTIMTSLINTCYDMINTFYNFKMLL